jgi:hypothetical protein
MKVGGDLFGGGGIGNDDGEFRVLERKERIGEMIEGLRDTVRR